MKKTRIEKAYAKINYHLHVGAKRADGFHDIETLMQTVSLADDVHVTIGSGSGISLTVVGNTHLPEDKTNLVWRAAERYLERISACYHVDIRLEKKIPVAGGLAGGSADAAATLRALNKLFDDRLDNEALCKLAGELGSDIPFCINGGLALCHGRGERITPLAPPVGERHFLIANGGEAVSTASAYQMLDRETRVTKEDYDVSAFLKTLTTDLSSLHEKVYNDFEVVVLPLCPFASSAKKEIADAGALFTMMSGSGSTVFGMFTSQEAALVAKEKLPFKTIYAHDVF